MPILSRKQTSITPRPSPAHSGGTTVQEAIKARDIYAEAKGGHTVIREVRQTLQEMAQPTGAENTALKGIEELLTAIVDKLNGLDIRLSSIESRLPVLRVVSQH